MKDNKRENSEKYIHFELKSFMNYSFENERIFISCGRWHSLALAESGRVFGRGDNGFIDIVYCYHVMEIFNNFTNSFIQLSSI